MPNTTTSRRRTRRLTLGLGVTVTAMSIGVLGAGAAHAEAGTSPEQGARIERVCAKVPTLEARIEAALARINGDATTVGSLAWLQDRIERAEAAGRTDVAAALQQRLEARTATAGLLGTMLERVATIGDRCEAWGAAQ
jgi:hypothetical protein